MSYLYENTIQKKTRIVHDKPPILRTISGVKTGRGPKSGTDPDFVDPYFGSQTLRTNPKKGVRKRDPLGNPEQKKLPEAIRNFFR